MGRPTQTLPAFTAPHVPVALRPASVVLCRKPRRCDWRPPVPVAAPALAPALAPPPPPRACASLGARLERALEARYGAAAVARVLASFRAVRAGEALETGAGTPAHRRAHSYVDGLDTAPFWDPARLPWVRRLEARWRDVAEELAAAAADPETARRGTNVWSAAARPEATAYGPDWRTLVLQDREWDPVNTSFFPVTSALLREGDLTDPEHVPSVEAFFARQAPGTGIALHTDDCNFILTLHLALDVPERQSWIEVAGERRYWENGQSLIFDTSFFHRTMNESPSEDRIVLLVRFWHPQLTLIEREAISFIFRAIEDPSVLCGVEQDPRPPTVAAVSSGNAVASTQGESRARPASATASGVPRAQRRAKHEKAKKRGKNTGRSSSGGGVGFGQP